MKKLIVLMILCIASMVFAIEPVINQAIDSSSWTAVTLGANQTCTSYAFQARDGSAFKISDNSSGTTYFTVKEDAGMSIKEHYRNSGSTLFYAQSVSGTPVIEVIILKQ